ncbi:MAG TPA: GNAT family N-acetyltransferase [Thermoplasmata archaeon]|nr:GNAT family N-acetyltransferase [Thermoplasmata archaeon]
MPVRLDPLATDLEASHRLGRCAATTRAGESRESEGWVRALEQRLAGGTVTGRLYVVDGRPTGFVSWTPGGPVGASVELLYVAPGSSDPEDYARILAAVETEVGPVAFVPGPLAGLAPGAEERLMRGLGYRRYGRSEMVLGDDAPDLDPPAEPGERLREVQRTDLPALAELHRRAYRDSFDRYLFLEFTDEHADALREVEEIVDGRWGEFLAEGSWVAERGGRPVGSVLSVRGTTGGLIADVMVDPDLQGHGVGRRVLATAAGAMRRAGVPRIYLNVTEGNDRAIRLYRRLGFVRSLGPTHDWYNARRIPVAPSPDA